MSSTALRPDSYEDQSGISKIRETFLGTPTRRAISAATGVGSVLLSINLLRGPADDECREINVGDVAEFCGTIADGTMVTKDGERIVFGEEGVPAPNESNEADFNHDNTAEDQQSSTDGLPLPESNSLREELSESEYADFRGNIVSSWNFTAEYSRGPELNPGQGVDVVYQNIFEHFETSNENKTALSGLVVVLEKPDGTLTIVENAVIYNWLLNDEGGMTWSAGRDSDKGNYVLLYDGLDGKQEAFSIFTPEGSENNDSRWFTGDGLVVGVFANSDATMITSDINQLPQEVVVGNDLREVFDIYAEQGYRPLDRIDGLGELLNTLK